MKLVSFAKRAFIGSLYLLTLAVSLPIQADMTTTPLLSGQSKTFNSEHLGREQDITVVLPANYEKETIHYPVVYLMDADFLLESAASITRMRAARDLMPKSIIVGLSTPNWSNRLSIAMPTKRESNSENVMFADSKPQSMLAFLQHELMPFIDAQYRTAPHSTLVGMSPTTGPVLTDYQAKSPIFSAHIALAANPHLYSVAGVSLSDELIKASKQNKTSHLYIARGELDLTNNSDTRAAFEKLTAGFEQVAHKQLLMADIVEGGEHYGMATTSLDNAFRHIYPESIWQPDYISIRDSEDPAQALAAFYQNLSKHYGFTAYPVIDGYWMGYSIAGTTRYLLRQKKAEDAIKMLDWAIAQQPTSIDLYYNLAQAHKASEDNAKAIKAAQKAVTLAEQQQDKDLSFFQDYLGKLQETE